MKLTLESVFGSNRDGVAANGKAVKGFIELKREGSLHFDVTCVSHFLSLVGERFSAPIADEFMASWRALFANSPKSKAAWKSLTSFSVVSSSETRWWSEWDQVAQVAQHFPYVTSFIKDEDSSPKSRAKLVSQMNIFHCKPAFQINFHLSSRQRSWQQRNWT